MRTGSGQKDRHMGHIRQREAAKKSEEKQD